MGVITYAQMVAWTDLVAAGAIKLIGTTGNAEGLGTGGWGASKSAVDLNAALKATDDDDLLSEGLSATILLKSKTLLAGLATEIYAPICTALARMGAKDTVSLATSFDEFCRYYNIGAGGPYACLLAPEFVQIYALSGAGTLSQYAGFFSIKQGTLYTNAIAKKVVGGAFTAGTNVNSALYAGGRARIKWSGMSGTGAVTVTGTWRKADGTLVLAKTGAYTISAAASGTEDLVPHSTDVGTGGLLVAVDDAGIAAGGTLASGTIYVETHEPTGRTYPPAV